MTPISVLVSNDGVPTPLITGEVTAVEVEHSDGETLTIVRGMDRSHRLMRGTKTMAYPEMTAAAVVTMLLGESEVLPGRDHPDREHLPVAHPGQRQRLGLHPAAGRPGKLRGLLRCPRAL